MSEQSTALATTRQFDLSPQTFDQALTFSNYLAESDMVPKDFKGKPGNCLVAMQWGMELGLKPLQAMQNIAVINGRPSLWGDAVLAIVRASSACEYVIEEDNGHTATCRVKRRGDPSEQIRTFSMDDAKTAGLMGKQGPWLQYPKRMRQMRARAFAVRDVFPDVLKGFPIAEEVMDIPAKNMGMVDEVATQTTSATPTPTALLPYPAESFDKNLSAWHKVIAEGRKTADQFIAFIESKNTMTEEQKTAIRTQPVAAPVAAPVISAAAITARMDAAQDLEQLDEAASLIPSLPGLADQKALNQHYMSLQDTFTQE
jgi:hypothetical protein